MFLILNYVLVRPWEIYMSDLYLDEIEKIKYYKEKIVDRYLKQAIPVNKEKLQDALDRIDMKIAIFSQAYIQSGNQFDSAIFNEQKQDIYRDLVVLYTVLYKLIQERIDKTEERLKFALNNLAIKAEQFRFLVDSEAVAVYGKTLFHQSSDFDQSYQDGQIIINLGSLDVPSGSYLACLFQCKEIDPSQIAFYFDNDYTVSAYQYDKQYLKIPGNYQIYTDFYTNEDDIFGKELIEINEEVSDQNQYIFYLNKNQISVKDRNDFGISYVNFNQGVYYQSSGLEEITFYVYGATEIIFDIIGEPAYTNFVDRAIRMPKQRQKIVIKTDSKLSFDVKTDGVIYAEQVSSAVQEDKLKLFNNFKDISNYMVETIQYGDDIHFNNVSVVIDDVNDTLLDIDYIVIKQTQVTELENE